MTQGLPTTANRQAPGTALSCSFLASSEPHHPVANKDLHNAQAQSKAENPHLMSVVELLKRYSAYTHPLQNTRLENAYVRSALAFQSLLL